LTRLTKAPPRLRAIIEVQSRKNWSTANSEGRLSRDYYRTGDASSSFRLPLRQECIDDTFELPPLSPGCRHQWSAQAHPNERAILHSIAKAGERIYGCPKGSLPATPDGLTYPLEAARQKRSLRCWGHDVIVCRSSCIRLHFLYQTQGPGNNSAGQMSADPCYQTLIRSWTPHRVWLLLLAMLLCQARGYSQLGPQPPCGKEPIPPYPGLGDLAIVKSWSKSDFGPDWRPPACTGWAAVGFTTLVTIAARFPYTSEAGGLLRHIGAISEFAGMRYWSTTHQQWRTLIVDAYALTGSQSGQRREDFSSDEMKEGKVLYFEQVDNLSGKAVYRMHIVEASANRLVFDVENVSTMRYFLIPILHPGDLQSMYFLDRESDNVWRYYSIVRTGKNANGLIAGNESSSVNRAVTFYRHLIGISTAQEPPGAR